VLVVVDDIGSISNAPDITPNPFTPNGDGINDVVTFNFDLFLLLENVNVEVDIHDLSGRRIVQLQSGSTTVGRQGIDWDGRDAAGKLVPPGLYVYRLVIGSDDASSEQVGTVSLAY
jgi:flagellar hook assembly protein FlgD